MKSLPKRTEADPYYFRYIDRVSDPDVVEVLRAQTDTYLHLLTQISEVKSLFRYSADKWSIRQVLNHVCDTERVFLYRALWFSRGFESPLPSFEQDLAVTSAAADECPWGNLVEEFRLIHLSTYQFFRNLPPAAWDKIGKASEKTFSVRAIAFIVAGHLEHHMAIIRERYLTAGT